ncbi:MAG: hypothetical protein ABI811_21855 [Acidobacteriota bacterium]
MKRTIASLLTTALLVLAPAFGQTPVVKERQENQKDRIKAGVKDGSITKAEAAKLKQEQRDINQDRKAAKADGVVTGKEKGKLAREQNKASRDILKQRKDKQKQK